MASKKRRSPKRRVDTRGRRKKGVRGGATKSVFVKSRNRVLQRRQVSKKRLESEFYKTESVRKGRKRVYYVRKKRFYKSTKLSSSSVKKYKRKQAPGYYRVFASFQMYHGGLKLDIITGYGDFFELSQERLDNAIEDAEYMALAITTQKYGLSGLEAELITYEIKRLRFYIEDESGKIVRQRLVEGE